MVDFDLAVHIGSSISFFASIYVLYFISKMPENARKTTGTRLVIHMACIEIPMCALRGAGDHAFDYDWLCDLQGTMLQLNVSIFLLSGCFINNTYLQIYKGWTERKCQDLLKPYLVGSYSVGIATMIGALASGQIGHESSWCGIKEHDRLLHFFLFYMPLMLVECFIVWAMSRVVWKIYKTTSAASSTEVGSAQRKNSIIRTRVRRKTLFRAVGFSMVMILSWGCDLADQLRGAITGAEEHIVVKQIQFVTVPLQGFWYALIFAVPVLEIHRRKQAQDKALHDKIRTASGVGVAMTISSHRSNNTLSSPPLADLEDRGEDGYNKDPEDPDWSEIKFGEDRVTKIQNITKI